MSQDATKKGCSQPSSLPPELTEFDSGWDDEVEPEADPAAASERPTVVPDEPLDQMVRRLMEQDDAPEIEVHDEHVILSLDELGDLTLDAPDAGRTAPDEGISTRPTAPIAAPDRSPVDQAPELELDDPSLSLDAQFAPTASAGRRRHDSLLDAPSAPSAPFPLTEPPELPPPTGPGAQEPALRELRDRYRTGDFSGALAVAERVLEQRPDDPDALRYLQRCREVLTQMYAARLGSLAQVVSVCLPRDRIRWLSLDHRAGFLLSLVDGHATVEEILDVSSMPRLDALRILLALHEQNVIRLEHGTAD
jgi:hypothetical protein